MGLDALKERLERDADAVVDAIRAAGAADALACVSKAGAQAVQLREARLEQRARERRVQLERELAVAHRKARAELLLAAHAVLDRVFDRATQLAESMGDAPDLRAALPTLLREVQRYLGARDVQLRCPPTLHAALRALLPDGLGVEVVVDPDMPIGIVARARDGSLTIDNTLAARLQRARPELEPMLLREALA